MSLCERNASLETSSVRPASLVPEVGVLVDEVQVVPAVGQLVPGTAPPAPPVLVQDDDRLIWVGCPLVGRCWSRVHCCTKQKLRLT